LLTVVHDAESANDNDGGAGLSVLDEIVRDSDHRRKRAIGEKSPARNKRFEFLKSPVA
jgi:hypothetical protein